ncbi:MAG: precorrin-6Y C5,15-methyltransferase (decarboxylating) subunit CbiT [bacterium]|nr:precorrin-6Y C5,15-methyltransferase (decarboxylating) subunit CbiT [bacterium]
MIWIPDEEFIRGTVPMTKFDVRVLTLAMLDIGPGDLLLDIGAGTGSIGIQAARLGAEVWAIERKPEGVELIRQNAAKFSVSIEVISGSAPEAIGRIPKVANCFIGGSGGKLKEIFEALNPHLTPGNRLVANFIKVENMVECKALLQQYKYQRIESRLIQSAQTDKHGLLRGQNPVFIVKGET